MNTPMFHCRSVSHHRTPLATREQLSLTADQQTDWLDSHQDTEAIIVSTCNRLELYAHVSTSRRMDALWGDLLLMRGMVPADVAAYTVARSGVEATQHLFRVSCGLESMALGEPQILGQIIHAHEHAHEHHTVGTALALLFRAAIHAAKRARTETHIANGSASVSSLGIARAEEINGPLTNREILVIGAGEMAQTIVKALVQRDVTHVTVLSRTYDHASRLAEEWGVHARPVTALKEAMIAADVVFTTSSAPYTILAREDVAPIMAARPDHALCIIDIAVPRDVARDVAQIPGICLHDIDDLQHVIEENLAEREADIPAVERIIEHELTLFWRQYRARSVVPTIRQLREHAEDLRQAELSWAYNRLDPANERERQLFDQFSHRFMNKMLHHVTLNLKAKAGEDDGALFAAVARDLFGLEEPAK
jgi:glutamyl-tRNA reductase